MSVPWYGWHLANLVSSYVGSGDGAGAAVAHWFSQDVYSIQTCYKFLLSTRNPDRGFSWFPSILVCVCKHGTLKYAIPISVLMHYLQSPYSVLLRSCEVHAGCAAVSVHGLDWLLQRVVGRRMMGKIWSQMVWWVGQQGPLRAVQLNQSTTNRDRVLWDAALLCSLVLRP